MRTHLLFAVRSLEDLHLDGLELGTWGNGTALRFDKLGEYPACEFLLRTLDEKAALPNETGTWLLLHLIPCSLDDDAGPALYRHLRRAALGGARNLRGPWTPKELDAKAPTLTAATCYAKDADGKPRAGSPLMVPLCIAGDEPVAIAAVVYAPTDRDCTEDKPKAVAADAEPK